VVEVLHSERFVDQAPAQVVAALLQEGVYHCSARTMYRMIALTHRFCYQGAERCLI
jgi:putative transposase